MLKILQIEEMDQNILTQVTLTYRQLRGENICVIEGKDLHLTKNEIVQVCEMIKEWKPGKCSFRMLI